MIFRRILFASLLVFHFLPSCAQKADSLRGALSTARGVERVDLLYALAIECMSTDQQAALLYATEGWQLARERNDSLRMVKMGLLRASALRRLQRIDAALVEYQWIVGMSERNNYASELAVALNSMAIAHTYKAEYDEALSCYFRSLRIREESGDERKTIPVLINIAVVYYKLKDYQRGLEIFLKALALQRAQNLATDASLLLNIAHCYAYLENFEDAEIYTREALTSCGADCSMQVNLAANFVQGLIAYGRESYARSERFFLESYRLASRVGDVRLQLDNVDYLSGLYMARRDDASAAHYLSQAEALIRTNPSFNLERTKIYGRLAELSLRRNEFKKAAYYQARYINVRDSVYSEEMTRNLMKAEAAFLERENTARIAAQEEIIALKEEVIMHQRILNRVVVLLALLCLTLVVVLSVWYRQKKAVNVMLERKVSDRTRELQKQSDALLAKAREYELYMNRTSHQVSETMRSIGSLCRIAKKEVSDPAAVACLDRIVSLTDSRQHCEESSGD